MTPTPADPGANPNYYGSNGYIGNDGGYYNTYGWAPYVVIPAGARGRTKTPRIAPRTARSGSRGRRSASGGDAGDCDPIESFRRSVSSPRGRKTGDAGPTGAGARSGTCCKGQINSTRFEIRNPYPRNRAGPRAPYFLMNLAESSVCSPAWCTALAAS